MSAQRLDTCARCKWWAGRAFLDRADECRRFAPKATIGQLDPDARYGSPERAGWPTTRRNEFCGEFEIREDATAPALRAVLEPIIDRLGAAEWADPAQAEDILSSLIDDWVESGRVVLAKARGEG